MRVKTARKRRIGYATRGENLNNFVDVGSCNEDTRGSQKNAGISMTSEISARSADGRTFSDTHFERCRRFPLEANRSRETRETPIIVIFSHRSPSPDANKTESKGASQHTLLLRREHKCGKLPLNGQDSSVSWHKVSPFRTHQGAAPLLAECVELIAVPQNRQILVIS